MISVVIPTCNRSRQLAQCLKSLEVEISSLDVSQYEVVITDDSPTPDGNTEIFCQRYTWIKWITGPRKGPAANRNNGAKEASGEWLIFLDDDCIPQKGWLANYLLHIQAYKNFLVFEGCTVADREKQRFDEEAPINLEGNKLWSCNFAIEKNLFIKLNGFDESFPYAAMEDVDFYTRVLQYTSIQFLPQAIVMHPWRRVKPFQNFKKHLQSHKYFRKKHLHYNSWQFRWIRSKIFLGSIFFSFKELVRYSMQGTLVYIERCLLNFCLIFI